MTLLSKCLACGTPASAEPDEPPFCEECSAGPEPDCYFCHRTDGPLHEVEAELNTDYQDGVLTVVPSCDRCTASR